MTEDTTIFAASALKHDGIAMLALTDWVIEEHPTEQKAYEMGKKV